MQKFKETIQDVVKKWKAGELVWSADLGGMGPGYEQAIQALLFEICAEWGDRPIVREGKTYPKEFQAFVDRMAGRLRSWGFSGAQVGQAQHTAFQFLTIGYSEMMNKLPEKRRIMVCDSLCPKQELLEIEKRVEKFLNCESIDTKCNAPDWLLAKHICNGTEAPSVAAEARKDWAKINSGEASQ